MIYLFLTENHETVEALTPVDVLRRAKIKVTTVSLTQSCDVASSCGITVKADKTYDDCDFSDAQGIILPGGAGTENYLSHEKISHLIKEQYKKGNLVAAICAAPRVLAANEIHVKSTIYPSLKDEVRDYSEEKIVVQKNAITANAMASSLQFSLEIVTYLRGKQVADEVASSICYN